MNPKKIFPFALITIVLLFPKLSLADDTTSYVTGKLLNVREEKQTRIVSYQTEKTKNGSQTRPVETTDDYFFISVKVADLIYEGRYKRNFPWSKKPNWIVGDPIQLRIDKNKMYLKRSDGKEIKAKIIKRTRAES